MKQLHILGEHYNARGLSPERIATSFVPPSQFEEVAAASNCVIVGPRGSGKTTLLRMLDPRALHAWRGDFGRAVDYPTYVGVFVPIDAAWVSALTNAARSPDVDNETEIYLSVYTLSIARSLIDVMRWRLAPDSEGSSFHITSKEVDEYSLAQKLAGLWLPAVKARSLLELRVEVSTEIAMLPRKLRRLSDSEKKDLAAIYLNPLELAAAACDLFNLYANDSARKWAILCDELEIAPLAIQEVLFGGLRAAPHPLLLKYALTPRQKIPFIEGPGEPLPANDFDVVPLSYPTREEGTPEREREQFCVALWRSLVNDICPDRKELLSNPFKVFEGAAGADSREIRAKRDLEAKFGDAFRQLAAKDDSFSNYINSKGVDLSNLNNSNQRLRDSVVRKVRPLVEIRNFYLGSDGSDKLKRVSRRVLTPYCGARQLFAVSEGHPRWLKYTLASMLSYLTSKGKIKIADQNRELENSLERIEARIRALPAEQMSTHDLIDALGSFFSAQVLGPVFRPDPSLSFIVDDGVDKDVITCLEQALYIGAIIPMKGNIYNLFAKGLVGERFRLSNWLAPFYKLPLVAGKATNLSTILLNRGEVVSSGAVQFSLRLENESFN